MAAPLQSRSILLHAEQGLGDTLHFVRYAALLKQQGAGRIVLACQAELVRLLARCPSIDEVVSKPPFPAVDINAMLLSLPRLLGTTSVERIPAAVPYVNCDPQWVESWEARLAALGAGRPGLRVGIAWRGSPSHRKDRWRSVSLDNFAPLAEQAGVRLISLQKGPGSEELAKIPGLAIDVGPELKDLADTAGLVACLDLVITVDTTVAHLAGALGTPVWVFLPSVPDWRWLLHRQDSPWYPSMRLFRQTERGRWDDVFGQLRDALAAHPVLRPAVVPCGE